uniref:Uncharacterized protein n=1 Tax=Oryza punctata TaxID=4537 RepID=A0A0E0KM55_ORYPU
MAKQGMMGSDENTQGPESHPSLGSWVPSILVGFAFFVEKSPPPCPRLEKRGLAASLKKRGHQQAPARVDVCGSTPLHLDLGELANNILSKHRHHPRPDALHPPPLVEVEEDGCRQRGLEPTTSSMEESTPLGLHHHEFVVACTVSTVSSLGGARTVFASDSSSLGGVTAGGDGRAWSSEWGGGGAPQMELTGYFGCSRNGRESEVEGKEEEKGWNGTD